MQDGIWDLHRIVKSAKIMAGSCTVEGRPYDNQPNYTDKHR